MDNKTQQNLPFERKEELINSLLMYMKNDIESTGDTIKSAMFNFSFSYTEKYFGDHPDEIISEGNDLKAFKEIINISDDEFDVVFKTCKTHGYLKNMFCGGGNNGIQLTEKGLSRATSKEKAEYYKPQEQPSSITINGPINTTHMQVGNNNTQNIETIINNLIDEVKKSNATPEDKNKALELINCFFANPIISSVISGVTGAGVTSLLGGI